MEWVNDEKFKIWRLYAHWHLTDNGIREFLKNGSFAVTEEEWEKEYSLNWGKSVKDIPDWGAKIYSTDKGIWKSDGYVFVVM